jgi:hypothetical protein
LKTIFELANEVKRLTKLIPRKVIDKDEETSQARLVSKEDGDQKSTEENDIDNTDKTNRIQRIETERQLLEKTLSIQREKFNKPAELDTASVPEERSFSFLQILFSFSMGAILMLIWLVRYIPT